MSSCPYCNGTYTCESNCPGPSPEELKQMQCDHQWTFRKNDGKEVCAKCDCVSNRIKKTKSKPQSGNKVIQLFKGVLNKYVVGK